MRESLVVSTLIHLLKFSICAAFTVFGPKISSVHHFPHLTLAASDASVSHMPAQSSSLSAHEHLPLPQHL